MTEKNKIQRPLIGRVVLAVVTLVLGLLGSDVAPAGAAHDGDGYGEQTHIGIPFQPNPACAYYSNYHAVVTFPGNPADATDDFVATIDSPLETNPGKPASPAGPTAPGGPDSWQEGPNGTHSPGSSCADTAGQVIGGDGAGGEPEFTVKLSGNRTCTDASASYSRNVTSITIYTTCGVNGTLHYTVAGSNAVPGSAVCNSIIAPSLCVIGPRV